MKGVYQEIFELAKPYLDTRDNIIHTKISYSFAEQLLETEGGDPRVVLPAILLHDIGWKLVPEELQLKAFGPGPNDMKINRIHEVEGSRNARLILEQIGYDPDLIQEIAEIILGHDSRTESLSLNDSIVKDADKLWRFSPEGLEIDPKRFGINPAVHTAWLGLQIERWFFTETGKTLAKREQRARAISFGIDPHEP